MGLKEDLKTVTVSQLNIRPPVTVPKSASVREAIQVMRAAGLGCAVVVDEAKTAVGIFTEGMLRHDLNESVGILDDSLANQMVARLPWVLPSDSAAMVLEAMEEHNLRFIAVLDEDRRVLGITGQKTMMEFIAEYFPREILTCDPTGVTTSQSKEGA